MALGESVRRSGVQSFVQSFAFSFGTLPNIGIVNGYFHNEPNLFLLGSVMQSSSQSAPAGAP